MRRRGAAANVRGQSKAWGGEHVGRVEDVLRCVRGGRGLRSGPSGSVSAGVLPNGQGNVNNMTYKTYKCYSKLIECYSKKYEHVFSNLTTCSL
jgi:hypothetical protein